MSRTYEQLDPPVVKFIEAQHMFFVATAPLDGGRVNLSPKGLDSFRVIDSNRVSYLDLTGSGAETIAHLNQNGRITFMFCAYEGPPRIIRIYGTGTTTLPGDDELEQYRSDKNRVSIDGLPALLDVNNL